MSLLPHLVVCEIKSASLHIYIFILILIFLGGNKGEEKNFIFFLNGGGARHRFLLCIVSFTLPAAGACVQSKHAPSVVKDFSSKVASSRAHTPPQAHTRTNNTVPNHHAHTCRCNSFLVLVHFTKRKRRAGYCDVEYLRLRMRH